MNKKAKSVKTTKNQEKSAENTMRKKSSLKKIMSWLWRKKWWLLLIIAIFITTCVMFVDKKTGKAEFSTIEITRGDLRHTVSATGEIQPLNTVSVGSQVSGTIEELFVDYNSKVKKGDVLLKIEPSVLQASVDEAKATLDSARSQRDYAKAEYDRNKSLYNDGFIARAEMEKSQTTYEQAEQSVKKAQSQYERAETNLGYATITSPVDGTVIARKVDKGQTVAASFQTPDLFEIAEDLSKMQIETAVSEADIGVIKEGQNVTFTVDAYPRQTFKGTVRQIRLSPTTASNVVIYTVVIDVDNSDLRLLPGMTAFVTVIISESFNVFKALNAAFLVRTFENIVDNPGEATPKTHLAILRDTDITLVPYKKGIVTSTETEIISDGVHDGDKIVVGRVGGESKQSGFGGGRRGGPGGMM